MTYPKAPKDKIFEKVINPYLMEVLQHPQSITMSEGILHICDVEGPKKTGILETRLEAMEQQVFKCQGMVEHGLNANHMMITEFTNNHKMDAIDIGKDLPRLYVKIDQLQGQIYDLQYQNYEFHRSEHLHVPGSREERGAAATSAISVESVTSLHGGLVCLPLPAGAGLGSSMV
ncbi:40S ribosomal protein S5-1 [Hordeum vulgare]|nr:40S ribosomal protein S5-1 [Hordeum vulgare]